MALYKNSRTYRAFDAENGCFFNKTFTFSYEIDEKYNKGIEKKNLDDLVNSKYSDLIKDNISSTMKELKNRPDLSTQILGCCLDYNCANGDNAHCLGPNSSIYDK